MGNIFKDFFENLSSDKNIEDKNGETKEKMLIQKHLYFLEKNSINLPNDIDTKESMAIQKITDIFSNCLVGILFLEVYYLFLSPFASIGGMNWHYINLIIGFFMIYGSIGYFFVQLSNFLRTSILRNYFIKEHRKKIAFSKGISYEEYFYHNVKNDKNISSEKI